MRINIWMKALAVALALMLPAAGLAAEAYGAAALSESESYTLEQMLTYALQDEYLARAEYRAIMDKYGADRPFSRVIRAEERHISQLLPLFEAHGLTAPEDEGALHVALPENLAEIYQTGITVEENNIAMYEGFLKQELPEDVRAVFQALMRASENHLRAFQRQLDRPTLRRP